MQLAVLVAIGACLLSCRRSESPTPGFALVSGLQPVAEIERALVSLADTAGGAPRCVGTVIASAAAESLVLTAAHCLQGPNGGARFVKPVLAARTSVRVKRSWLHPRFVQGVATSSYDAALLVVQRLAGTSVAPLGAAASVADGATLLTLAGDAVQLERVRVTRSQTLALTFTHTSDRACHGASGAPLLSEQQGGARVIGLVSHGPNDCIGEAIAGRVTALVPGFIAALAAGDGVSLAPQRCAECLEASEATSDACVTASARCQADASCAAGHACLQRGEQDLR
jgi:hypothetical protein